MKMAMEMVLWMAQLVISAQPDVYGEEQTLQKYTLENEHVRLVFDALARPVILLNKHTGTHLVNANAGEPSPVFIIDAYSANQAVTIDDLLLRESGGFSLADPASLFSTERSGDLYRLAMPSAAPPEITVAAQDGIQTLTSTTVLEGDIRVTMSVALPADSVLSRWSIAVDNVADTEPAEHLRVYRVLFPLLSRLCVGDTPEANCLARPYIQGELIPNPAHHDFLRPKLTQVRTNVLTYPGWASMPWMDLYAPVNDGQEATNGLYFASYDPNYQQLDIETVPAPDTGTIAMGMRTLAFLEPGETWQSQTFVVGLHTGDWHWAADQYRTDSSAWLDPATPPEWVKHCDGWFGSGGPNYRFSDLPAMLEDARWLGLDYLQCWSEMLENVGPDRSRKPYYCFFLPDPERGGEKEMQEGVRQVRQQGGHIGFYSNVWTWDADSGRCLQQWQHAIPEDVSIPFWSEFRNYMSVFPDGHMEAGDFLDGYAGSCPGAEGWRHYLKFWIVDKYVRQYGVDAWYLDSFPVTMFAAARVCFSPHHGDGRPHGVGHGLLKLARMLREASQETVSLAITCESVNDLFMSTNSHALGLELIEGITRYPRPEIFTYTFPHYPIFSGSCNGAGSGLKSYYDDLDDANRRRDTLNRVFLMGYRFDILGHKLNRENPDMRYLRDLIALRQRIKEDLYASSFQDEEGLGELPRDVHAKVFRHDRLESLSIVFLDRRTTKQSMMLTVDTAKLKLPRMRTATLYTLDGNQTEVEMESSEDGMFLVRIPVRVDEPAVLLLRRQP